MSSDNLNRFTSQARKTLLDGTITINDLREKEFQGAALSEEEILALKNFDAYRLSELNRQETEMNFHNKYIQLQVMANMSPFEEFLKEKYRIEE